MLHGFHKKIVTFLWSRCWDETSYASVIMLRLLPAIVHLQVRSVCSSYHMLFLMAVHTLYVVFWNHVIVCQWFALHEDLISLIQIKNEKKNASRFFNCWQRHYFHCSVHPDFLDQNSEKKLQIFVKVSLDTVNGLHRKIIANNNWSILIHLYCVNWT